MAAGGQKDGARASSAKQDMFSQPMTSRRRRRRRRAITSTSEELSATTEPSRRVKAGKKSYLTYSGRSIASSAVLVTAFKCLNFTAIVFLSQMARPR